MYFIFSQISSSCRKGIFRIYSGENQRIMYNIIFYWKFLGHEPSAQFLMIMKKETFKTHEVAENVIKATLEDIPREQLAQFTDVRFSFKVITGEGEESDFLIWKNSISKNIKYRLELLKQELLKEKPA